MTTELSTTAQLFVHVTVGKDYDSQEELLFKNPLSAFLRASTHSFSPLSLTKPVSVKSLRYAWNSFARLLNINYAEAFHCPIRGPSPSTVICDGTLLGFRKDLLNSFETGNSPSIKQHT